jgi:putative heme-binding domain-containing protein
MLAKICPWALVCLLLAAAGVAVATLTGVRWLTLTLASLGVVTVIVGMAAARRKHTADDWAWLGLGTALSSAVLGITLFAPGSLNPNWDAETPLVQTDSEELVRIPADQPEDPGRHLGEEEWVDSASEGIRQDDLIVVVKGARAGEALGTSGSARLEVTLWARQLRVGRTIHYEEFARDRHTPVLTDAAGRRYAFLGHYPIRFSKVFDVMPHRLDYILTFELPATGVEPLKLSLPASAWGNKGAYRFVINSVDREPPRDLTKEVAHYKKLLRTPPETPPDAMLGRAVFAKHCRECHTLFGDGGKTGPDLTASKREDLDFLVTSVANPSAEIAKGFEPWLITTNSGKLIIGIIKEATANELTVQTTGPKVTVPLAEIEDKQPSKVSLMPVDLLKPFDEHEVRSLFKYLAGKAQVPILARPETAVFFSSHGPDLSFWQRRRGDWRVERGEIISRGTHPLLVSDLTIVGDFRVSLRVNPGKAGRGAVRLGDADHGVPRVEFMAGMAPVLVDGDGERATGDAFKAVDVKVLQPDSWSRLEIVVVGPRIEVRLDGRTAAVLTNVMLPKQRVIGLEGHDSTGAEMRFTHLELELPNTDKEGR